MRHLAISLIALFLIALPAVAAQNAETIEDMAGDQYIEPVPGDVWGGPRDVLFDNGPVFNCAGCGVGGADESILWVISLEMNTLGFGHQIANNNWMADDFTIPADEVWTIEGFTFFAYQTGSTTDPSTINDYRVIIYDDMPDVGNVVYGDEMTNVLISSAWANVYRVTDTTTGSATNRPIMASECMPDAPFQLGPGTYWIAWQAGGTLTSGPWAPPLALDEYTCETGNGLQGIAGVWGPALDSGIYACPQGLPFILSGTIDGGVPVEESSWGQVKRTF
jgi:hypothetical protein